MIFLKNILLLSLLTTMICVSMDPNKMVVKVEPASFIVFGPYYKGTFSYLSLGYNLETENSMPRILSWISNDMEFGIRLNPNISQKIVRTIDKSPIDVYTTIGIYGKVNIFENLKSEGIGLSYDKIYASVGMDYSRWRGISNLSSGEYGIDAVALFGIALGVQFNINNKIGIFAQLNNSQVLGYRNSIGKGVIYRGRNQSYDRIFLFSLGIELPFALFKSEVVTPQRPSIITQSQEKEYRLSINTKIPSYTDITIEHRNIKVKESGTINVQADGNININVIEKKGPQVILVDLSDYDETEGGSERIKKIIMNRLDKQEILIGISDGIQEYIAMSANNADFESIIDKISTLSRSKPNLFKVLDRLSDKYSEVISRALEQKQSELVIISSKISLDKDVLSETAQGDFLSRFSKWNFTKIPLDRISIVVPSGKSKRALSIPDEIYGIKIHFE